MAEYIECEAARVQLILNDELHAADLIKSIPAADVRPVVHGRWEVDGHHIRCSICGEYMCIKDREGTEIPRKYCPNCGADMREPPKEET